MQFLFNVLCHPSTHLERLLKIILLTSRFPRCSFLNFSFVNLLPILYSPTCPPPSQNESLTPRISYFFFHIACILSSFPNICVIRQYVSLLLCHIPFYGLILYLRPWFPHYSHSHPWLSGTISWSLSVCFSFTYNSCFFLHELYSSIFHFILQLFFHSIKIISDTWYIFPA